MIKLHVQLKLAFILQSGYIIFSTVYYFVTFNFTVSAMIMFMANKNNTVCCCCSSLVDIYLIKKHVPERQTFIARTIPFISCLYPTPLMPYPTYTPHHLYPVRLIPHTTYTPPHIRTCIPHPTNTPPHLYPSPCHTPPYIPTSLVTLSV